MTAACWYRVLLIASIICLTQQAIGTAQADLGDSPLIPFQPRSSPSESDRDRQAAAAYFAHARLLELQGQRLAALRRYQRAWRYDEEAVAILKHIASLAHAVNRPHEAARFAILGAEHSSDNADQLLQLGLYLVEQGETGRAIRLFEQARDLRKDDPPDIALVSLHIELGRFHLAREDAHKAVERFSYVRPLLDDPAAHGLDASRVARLLAQQVRLFAVMGEAYLRDGDVDTAATLFRRAYVERQDEAALSFHLARVAKAKGEVAAAQERLEAYFAAKQSSEGTAPYDLWHGINLLQQADPARAGQAVLQKLLHLHAEDPTNVPLRYGLAQRLFDSEQYAPAREHYVDLLESSGTAVAYKRLAELANRTADAELLLRVATKAVQETESLDILRADGEPLANDELLAASIKLAQTRVAEQTPTPDVPLAATAALLAVEADDVDVTQSLLAASLTRQELAVNTICEAVGLSLFMREHFAAAAKVFRAGIGERRGEETAQFHYYLSGALELAGRTDDALKAAEAGAEALPNVAALQLRPAWVLYHAKRYEPAEARYLALLERYDADRVVQSRQTARDIRYALSNICSSQKRFEEAQEWLEQILDEFPRDSSALNDLGYLWADRGEHLERALRMVGIAVTAEPDSIAYRDSLGWAYFRLGQFQDAVRELKRAAGGGDPDGVILDHLGDAYRSVGQVEEALQSWRRARQGFAAAQDADAVRRVTLKIENELLE